jgi:pimeloyl-ACP methyl ester carboxylesterase
MPSFKSFDGTELAYTDDGSGPPVLLLHGFGSSGEINFHRPGVVDALVGAGHRVITPDARGHGGSGKPHDPAAYVDDALSRDVSALIDHLGLDEVDLVGYSMGGIVGLSVAARDPRVRSLAVGGTGANASRSDPERESIADALDADDPGTIESPRARAFRAFADATRADRHALALLQRSGYVHDLDLGDPTVPMLVVTGEADTLAGPADAFAARFADARAVTVPGDHISAATKPELRAALVDVLAR